jgi:hypothetical protein
MDTREPVTMKMLLLSTEVVRGEDEVEDGGVK